jgi:capsular polysaccharide transport system permease protein
MAHQTASEKTVGNAPVELDRGEIRTGGPAPLARQNPNDIVDLAAGGPRPHAGGGRGRLPRLPFYPLTFFLFVLLPSLVTALYFAWIASDQFVTETRFAVRSSAAASLPTDSLRSAMASMATGAGLPGIANQDSHVIAQYLRSRAAITDIMGQIDIRAVYARSDADFWARLKSNASMEDLELYWRDRVSVTVDGPSGIVSLFVRAFTPDESLKISKALIRAAETLINALSERARQDTLEKAEAEVRRAEAMVRRALLDLKGLRDERGILDPATTASGTSQLLLQSLAERIRLQNDLSVMSQALAQNAPTITTLKAQLEAVDAQIATLRKSLTSVEAQPGTLSAFLVQFETMEIQRLFAEKLYLLAQNALERARARAEQKQVYLTVFMPPSLPEEARFPERLVSGLILPVVFLILWGIFALVCAAIEDHRI